MSTMIIRLFISYDCWIPPWRDAVGVYKANARDRGSKRALGTYLCIRQTTALAQLNLYMHECSHDIWMLPLYIAARASKAAEGPDER